MSKPIHINDEVLARYLAGQGSQQDTQAIEAWLEADTAHVLELEKYRKLWELKAVKNGNFEPNTNLAWQKVASRIANEPTKQKNKTHVFLRPWSLAASVLLVLGIAGYIYYFKNNTSTLETITSHHGNVQKLLADSSRVFLNKNSSLSYPNRFAKNERKVKLSGEAFFDIKPMPEAPFAIEVERLQVKVLGTSFNIDEDSSTINVIVRTGTVEVAKQNGDKIVLIAGQQALYYKATQKLIKKYEADANEYAYVNKVFKFKNTKLSEVVRLMSKGYQTEISLNEKELGQLAITTSFENESLQDALNIIAETLQIKLEAKDKGYVFVKK